MQFPDLPLNDTDPFVDFYFEDVTFELPHAQSIADWLFAVAEAENIPFRGLNCIFCSDEHLRKINVEYLEHDYFTDIITFPYAENAIHGDLFISADRVRENAASNNVDFIAELHRVMVHGVLHLCGYSDKTPDETRLMREKENEYLSHSPLSV